MEIGHETCNNTCAMRLNSIYEGHFFLNLVQHAGQRPTSCPTPFATKEQTTGAQYTRRLCGDHNQSMSKNRKILVPVCQWTLVTQNRKWSV